MADKRINDLPLENAPTGNERLAIDGASTKGAVAKTLVYAARPTASQAEALAGADADKVMTPLTTSQAIAAKVSAAGQSGSYNDLTNKPTIIPTTRTISAGTGLTGGGDLTANRTISLSASSVTSLGLANTAVQPGSLAAVATSGDYTSLANKPTLGTLAAFNVPPYFISGLEPDRVNANVLQFFTGACSIGGSNPTGIIRSTSILQVNFTITGVGGVDVSPTPVVDTPFHFYICEHLTNGTVMMMASREITYGAVTYPSGYGAAKCRKIPWSIVYRATGGIPSFAYLAGSRTTILTDFDDSGVWDINGAFNVDTGGSFSTVSLTNFLADNARMAILQVEARYNSGAGYVRLRPGSGSSSAGQVAAYVSASGERAVGPDIYQLTNSTREIQFKTDTGVRAWVRFKGWVNSEFS